ncbi:MAG: DUF4350 domain-containing protein [Acidobacteriaceae bacterium]|nr:DUF4350 domain-containing protein [Acidobacteriaceae bacterium]
MPSAITPADRKFLWATTAVAAILLAGTVFLVPEAQTGGQEVPSTYSAGSGGSLAAYLLLKELHYDVRRWQNPPGELGPAGPGTMLILASPTETPSNREKEAVRAYVRRGGRVLFCGESVHEFFSEAAAAVRVPQPNPRSFSPMIPSALSRGANSVVITPEARWLPVNPLQVVLYGDSGGAAVVGWSVGEGEVLWWAGASPLTNGGLRLESNLRLLLNSIGNASTIYWDEYFHGQRPSLWAYIAKTSAALGLAQFALLVAAILFTFSRRWGPIVAAPVVSRLSPLEFVDTLGGLYERAGATQVAVAVAARNLRGKLARQLALPASTSDSELATAAGLRLGWNGEELRTALERASATERMRGAQALELVQQLQTCLNKLGVHRKSHAAPTNLWNTSRD